MSAYCEKCGELLTSLFCESCGAVSSNIPTSFSTDDSLAGLLASVIRQGKPLLFSEVLTLTKSLDRTHRIFAQLEKTGNHKVVKQNNDYLITVVSSELNKQTPNLSISKENKINLLKSLLTLFPLSEKDIYTLFPLQVNLHEFVKYLGSDYKLERKNDGFFIRKKN